LRFSWEEIFLTSISWRGISHKCFNIFLIFILSSRS
jgi:hypothetical protein